jgi:hypothetical protein
LRPSPPEASASNCPFPAARPTYLPWIEQDARIPSPDRARDNESDFSGLYWVRQKDRPSYFVLLYRESAPPIKGGEKIEIPLASAKRGQLFVDVTGNEGGDATIVWFEAGEECQETRLQLVTSGRMSSPEVRREILRIAESFRFQ